MLEQKCTNHSESTSRIVTILEGLERDMKWVRKLRDGNGEPAVAVRLKEIELRIEGLRKDVNGLSSLIKWIKGLLAAGFTTIFLALIKFVITNIKLGRIQ